MEVIELWNQYWVWLALALALGIMEILVPGYILLGFAIAAAAIGVIFAAGVGPADMMAASLPITLSVYGGVSLATWLGLRHFFGRRDGQVKVWDKDIND